MAQLDIEQLERDFKQQYELLLDLLAHVLYANKDLSLRDVNDGERLESAHGLAFKFFCHALTLLYLSNGTNQELPSLKWHSVDFASIDVITRAAIESFLIFHHVFHTSAEPEEKDYRYWAYRAEGIANRQSTVKFDSTKEERQQVVKEREELYTSLESNQIFQNLSNRQKGEVFKGHGMWRLESATRKLLSWRAIGIKAGFSRVVANYVYSNLCGVAHSTSIGVRQTMPTLNKKEEEHLYSGTVVIMNIVTANLIVEYCGLFPKAQDILNKDTKGIGLVKEWIQKGRRLDTLMGID